jgi:hypothetical protein
LSTRADFAPAVFLPSIFLFAAAFFKEGFVSDLVLGAAFFVASEASDFLTVLPTDLPFFTTLFFSFVCLFLVFFLAAIGGVYHRHIRAAKTKP